MAKKNSKQEKERITILVSEDRKNKWLEFSKSKNFSTLSKLIRESVEMYIESSLKQSPTTTISKLSHDLKEPLTAIKGFSHLLIENYKDKLDWGTLSKIKEVYDQSLTLEGIIANALGEFHEESLDFDVLLVDDDNSTNKVLLDFFQIKGYTCKDVISGEGTFRVLELHRPKVILLDILLPDISGYEICKKIKSDKNYRDIPIYFITAVPENEVKAKMNETMADGYFLKPFNFPDFEILFSLI
jgi:CheY-like chemotaxis protein